MAGEAFLSERDQAALVLTELRRIGSDRMALRLRQTREGHGDGDSSGRPAGDDGRELTYRQAIDQLDSAEAAIRHDFEDLMPAVEQMLAEQG